MTGQEQENKESLSVEDVLRIWSKVTGCSPVSAEMIKAGLYSSAELRSDDGGNADLRLSFRKHTCDWCVYANDMGRGDKTESSVRLIAEVVKKLKLEGVNVGYVNVQGAYDNSQELKEMIDSEIGEK